ncbi:hypothetical protein M8J77_021133 [Diaphorina citri]|nr:hypothetical protein M8J77_021133 [Diaphorina citri]
MSNPEDDLYDDVFLSAQETVDPEVIKNLKQEIEKLQLEKSSLHSKIEKLSNANSIIKKENEILKTNMSSLFKTAQNELERKSRMIDQLRLNSVTKYQSSIQVDPLRSQGEPKNSPSTNNSKNQSRHSNESQRHNDLSNRHSENRSDRHHDSRHSRDYNSNRYSESRTDRSRPSSDNRLNDTRPRYNVQNSTQTGIDSNRQSNNDQHSRKNGTQTPTVPTTNPNDSKKLQMPSSRVYVPKPPVARERIVVQGPTNVFNRRLEIKINRENKKLHQEALEKYRTGLLPPSEKKSPPKVTSSTKTVKSSNEMQGTLPPHTNNCTPVSNKPPCSSLIDKIRQIEQTIHSNKNNKEVICQSGNMSAVVKDKPTESSRDKKPSPPVRNREENSKSDQISDKMKRSVSISPKQTVQCKETSLGNVRVNQPFSIFEPEVQLHCESSCESNFEEAIGTKKPTDSKPIQVHNKVAELTPKRESKFEPKSNLCRVRSTKKTTINSSNHSIVSNKSTLSTVDFIPVYNLELSHKPEGSTSSNKNKSPVTNRPCLKLGEISIKLAKTPGKALPKPIKQSPQTPNSTKASLVDSKSTYEHSPKNQNDQNEANCASLQPKPSDDHRPFYDETSQDIIVPARKRKFVIIDSDDESSLPETKKPNLVPDLASEMSILRNCLLRKNESSNPNNDNSPDNVTVTETSTYVSSTEVLCGNLALSNETCLEVDSANKECPGVASVKETCPEVLCPNVLCPEVSPANEECPEVSFAKETCPEVSSVKETCSEVLSPDALCSKVSSVNVTSVIETYSEVPSANVLCSEVPSANVTFLEVSSSKDASTDVTPPNISCSNITQPDVSSGNVSISDVSCPDITSADITQETEDSGKDSLNSSQSSPLKVKRENKFSLLSRRRPVRLGKAVVKTITVTSPEKNITIRVTPDSKGLDNSQPKSDKTDHLTMKSETKQSPLENVNMGTTVLENQTPDSTKFGNSETILNKSDTITTKTQEAETSSIPVNKSMSNALDQITLGTMNNVKKAMDTLQKSQEIITNKGNVMTANIEVNNSQMISDNAAQSPKISKETQISILENTSMNKNNLSILENNSEKSSVLQNSQEITINEKTIISESEYKSSQQNSDKTGTVPMEIKETEIFTPANSSRNTADNNKRASENVEISNLQSSPQHTQRENQNIVEKICADKTINFEDFVSVSDSKWKATNAGLKNESFNYSGKKPKKRISHYTKPNTSKSPGKLVPGTETNVPLSSKLTPDKLKSFKTKSPLKKELAQAITASYKVSSFRIVSTDPVQNTEKINILTPRKSPKNANTPRKMETKNQTNPVVPEKKIEASPKPRESCGKQRQSFLQRDIKLKLKEMDTDLNNKNQDIPSNRSNMPFRRTAKSSADNVNNVSPSTEGKIESHVKNTNTTDSVPVKAVPHFLIPEVLEDNARFVSITSKTSASTSTCTVTSDQGMKTTFSSTSKRCASFESNSSSSLSLFGSVLADVQYRNEHTISPFQDALKLMNHTPFKQLMTGTFSCVSPMAETPYKVDETPSKITPETSQDRSEHSEDRNMSCPDLKATLKQTNTSSCSSDVLGSDQIQTLQYELALTPEGTSEAPSIFSVRSPMAPTQCEVEKTPIKQSPNTPQAKTEHSDHRTISSSNPKYIKLANTSANSPNTLKTTKVQIKQNDVTPPSGVKSEITSRTSEGTPTSSQQKRRRSPSPICQEKSRPNPDRRPRDPRDSSLDEKCLKRDSSPGEKYRKRNSSPIETKQRNSEPNRNSKENNRSQNERNKETNPSPRNNHTNSSPNGKYNENKYRDKSRRRGEYNERYPRHRESSHERSRHHRYRSPERPRYREQSPDRSKYREHSPGRSRTYKKKSPERSKYRENSRERPNYRAPSPHRSRKYRGRSPERSNYRRNGQEKSIRHRDQSREKSKHRDKSRERMAETPVKKVIVKEILYYTQSSLRSRSNQSEEESESPRQKKKRQSESPERSRSRNMRDREHDSRNRYRRSDESESKSRKHLESDKRTGGTKDEKRPRDAKEDLNRSDETKENKATHNGRPEECKEDNNRTEGLQEDLNKSKTDEDIPVEPRVKFPTKRRAESEDEEGLCSSSSNESTNIQLTPNVQSSGGQR